MTVGQKPNMRQILLAGVIAIAVFILTQATGFAKIPEPDNIIYGIAGNDAVTIALKVDGEPITSYTLGDNPDAGLFYILRVPMDSLAPFEDGKARIGDEAFIYINDGVQPVGSVVLGGRGNLHRLDLGTTDGDNDDIPDEWEQQIIDADTSDEYEHPYQVMPRDDFDNDRFCNMREWLAGSSPIDSESIPPCWGDVFGDGDVDAEDLAIFIEEYEQYFGYHCPDCALNVDGDEDLDEWDFVFFCEDFGRTDCW